MRRVIIARRAAFFCPIVVSRSGKRNLPLCLCGESFLRISRYPCERLQKEEQKIGEECYRDLWI